MRDNGGSRRIGIATLLVIVALSAITAWPARAASGDGAADRLVALTNGARSDAGLAGLAVTGDLVDVARGQAERMAAERRIYHNPNLGNEVSGWQKVAENVGVGYDADGVHQEFMGSSIH